MRNVRVRVAYDGSRFFGWQRQAGFDTVQAALEEALADLTGQAITVHGAGRTDTGVHALGQVANFHVATRLADERLLFALNAHLRPGVVLQNLETCPDGFHALRDSCGKRYAYLVRTTRFRPPMGTPFHHWEREPLDLGAMRRAARVLVGRHDFTAFANSGSPRRSNVRHLRSVRIVARRAAFGLVVEGDGFLYNMVRTIAGTLIEVGRGKRRAEGLADALASRERSSVGPTAPPNGLYLLRVLYRPRPFLGGTAGRGSGLFSGV